MRVFGVYAAYGDDGEPRRFCDSPEPFDAYRVGIPLASRGVNRAYAEIIGPIPFGPERLFWRVCEASMKPRGDPSGC